MSVLLGIKTCVFNHNCKSSGFYTIIILQLSIRQNQSHSLVRRRRWLKYFNENACFDHRSRVVGGGGSQASGLTAAHGLTIILSPPWIIQGNNRVLGSRELKVGGASAR